MEHGGTMFMYRIIKVLNNNGILVYDDHTGREMILLGNGVGFGKRPAQQIGSLHAKGGLVLDQFKIVVVLAFPSHFHYSPYIMQISEETVLPLRIPAGRSRER